MKNPMLKIFGIFLILDGILSIAWQQADGCLNNSLLGNIVRILRAFIGLMLVIYSEKVKM